MLLLRHYEPGKMDVQKRDELALRALWLMNEILIEREELNGRLKSGFIQMAQARYVLGNKAVSSLQLPAVMTSTCSLDVEEKSETGETFPYRTIVKGARPTVPSGGGDADNKEDTESDEDEEDCGKNKFTGSDPLKWFGILVPATLRRSQADFSSTIECSVRLVNYQAELMKIVSVYKEEKGEEKSESDEDKEVEE